MEFEVKILQAIFQEIRFYCNKRLLISNIAEIFTPSHVFYKNFDHKFTQASLGKYLTDKIAFLTTFSYPPMSHLIIFFSNHIPLKNYHKMTNYRIKQKSSFHTYGCIGRLHCIKGGRKGQKL